jgi:hypothetical protein
MTCSGIPAKGPGGDVRCDRPEAVDRREARTLLSARRSLPNRMSKKRPLAPASPTDEWGIYDPAKAGMQALYSRLGRPIIRASEASERRARRRGLKVDRPADGVGMAIEEAKRRAGLMAAPPAAPPPLIPDPVPAPVAAVPTAPVAAPAAEAAPAPMRPARTARAKTPKATRRKQLSSAISAAGARMDAAASDEGVATGAASAPADETPVATPRRGSRKAPKSRQAATAAVAPAAVVPPPSPRRPRGPVPLAAWAHAVSDTTRPEPKRSEGKGLWRGIFRIPSEVALVEYGRGCRIHRLVIETASESLVDPF